MISRKLQCVGLLLAAGMTASMQAQPPKPAPPAPPFPPEPPAPVTVTIPAPRPMASPKPMPALRPLDPLAPWTVDVAQFAADAKEMAMAQSDLAFSIASDVNVEVQERVHEQIERAMEKADEAQARIAGKEFRFEGLKEPFLIAQNINFKYGGRRSGEEGLYEDGKRSLDDHRYDQALERFNEVVSRGGSYTDGALYWKAYTLNKLGRRDEALAAITELRKVNASSHWLDDAKALELEVKQASGAPVTPESQGDDEIKLLALNGLMQSNPERGFPILEKLLKSAQSPALKKRAVFVLAESNTPRAQQLLEQLARGNGNPDLQLLAINYMSAANRKQNSNGQVLSEIYASSNDMAVKRALLNAFAGSRDTARLLEIAKTEKNQELRLNAIRILGGVGGQADMWQLYQQEGSPEVKQQILASMAGAGNSDRLLEVARTEKDPKLRRMAIQTLGGIKSANAGDAMVSIYGGEQDPQVKRAIVNALHSMKNVKGMVDLGRKETDPEMKRYIVQRLVDVKSPEATAFLEEILK